MPLKIAYWVTMLVWVLSEFAVRGGYASGTVSAILIFVLFIIIGLQNFGNPLQG